MKRQRMLISGVLLLCLILQSCHRGSIVHRKLFVPDEFPTLEEALKIAVSGDTIIVGPGRYSISSKGISITQEKLTLRSALGAKETILMGTGNGPVVSFGKDCQAVFDGFTVMGSDPNRECPLKGGGILCDSYSSPTIINSSIRDNKAQFGGGIYCAPSSSPSILQNTISDNQATVLGGGIFSFHASPKIMKNRIIRNTAHFGAGLFCNADKALIQNNFIVENKALHSGGGCSCIDSSATLVNNTLARNHASFGGGIFGSAGEFQVLNTILWGNQDDLCLIDFKMLSRPRFSDIQDADYLGINGNISQDPLFIDPNQGDYRLSPESVCHHAGDSQKMYNNPDSSRNTIGAQGGPEAFTF
ncbi:MAG: right-handed parallel beta-helix repeat-containing protein [bacterium]